MEREDLPILCSSVWALTVCTPLQRCYAHNVGRSPPWLPNVEETFGIEKQLHEEPEIMDCHGDSEQSNNTELRILKTESAKMERSIVSTRDFRNGNLY
ncbi:hypothetical protein BB561_004062 [Smittium simulii]|uniref:Uncharacterized protein n=1 Tax=Smittium simulii TaxID=133385 RepID=A0A2T9YIA8_9FUNG|nr:hypothetical protein BB561_004062 [Smittium simulii]